MSIEKSFFGKRVLRSMPQAYSLVCKSRLFYSRSGGGKTWKILDDQHKSLLSMSTVEAHHCKELSDQGFTVLPNFFDLSFIDELFRKADQLFKGCQVSTYPMYSGSHSTLAGLSYEELAETQVKLALRDPLFQIQEFVDIVFHESLLRIVANFLKYIPTNHQGVVFRNFSSDGPKQTSFFHKDNDHIDSVNIFVYLMDAGDTTGYQIYVPGSHRHDIHSCKPMSSRDLGVDIADGNYSDSEIKRHFPNWAFLKPKRGSVGIISGNGIHKGPIWRDHRDPLNIPRTTFVTSIYGGPRIRTTVGMQSLPRRIQRRSYEQFNSLQKLFADGYELFD